MTSRGRKAEVDLVEGGEQGTDSGPPGARGIRRGLRWWPVAVLVVVGLFLAWGQRERAAGGAEGDLFAAQWHRLAGLGNGPELAWRVDDVGQYPSVTAAEDVYLVGVDTELGMDLLALDAASGTQRWRTELRDERLFCDNAARSLTAPSPGTVVCRADTADGSALVLLDLATGERLASRDGADLVDATDWHGGVLFVASEASGTQVRLEGFDGSERWVVPVLDRALATSERVWFHVAGDRAMVVVGERALALDVDGTVLLDVASPDATLLYPHVLPDGGFLLTGWDGNGPLTVVYGADGALRFEAQAEQRLLGFDDGSLGDVLVLSAPEGTEVRDAVSGESLGRVAGTPDGYVYVVDGALVFANAGKLRAVVAATGDERWSVDVGYGVTVGTDGNVVLVHGHESLGASIWAYDVATGTEAWVYELPGPGAEPLVVGGALLIHDGETLTRLAPSD